MCPHSRKKWDPGILDPSRFSGQIRKVEAQNKRCGKKWWLRLFPKKETKMREGVEREIR